ncbi:RNA polymerase sigma factor [Virgibacillus kekensis]|uniref:RNA polymerase sigma factor n=1 Tax=Virgibacillus kekensis TaxID=202261 RepID=A0ABV9DL63_9BACI
MLQREISEWFYHYSKDIYHYLVYYIGAGDVEDLVQEVFIRAIKSYDSFQRNSTPKTWLLSIARNVGIDEIRRRKRSKIMYVVGLRNQEPQEEDTPEDILHLTERNKELYKTIQSLKPNYRDVLILRAIKELTVSESAEILNWNENKVRITYHRALKTLSKEMEGILYEK